MSANTRIKFLIALAVLTVVQLPALRLSAGSQPLSRAAAESDRARLNDEYAKLPMSFESNQGQSDSSVKFVSHGRGYEVFLKSTEAMLVFSKTREAKRIETVVRMQLLGANRLSEIKGVDELPGKANYFIGGDPSKWRTNIPTYAKVRYGSIYPGIDLTYYGSGPRPEYDFDVSPGADPGAPLIRVALN